MKQFTLLFIFCIGPFFVFGQNYGTSFRNDAKKAFENGDYKSALEYYNASITMGASEDTEFKNKIVSYEKLRSSAEESFKQGKNSEAIARYQELLKRNPSDRNAKKRIEDIEKQQKIKVSFGIKGGLNLSNILNSTKDIDFSPKFKPALHAGVVVNMRFGGKKGHWGLQPELLYSNQGFMIDGNAVNFHYLTFPVMVKLYLGKEPSKRNFNIEFGPFFSYLMAVKPSSITISGSTVIGDKYDLKLSDLKNGKDIGIAVGIGYDFWFGLMIGARYNQGLSDMANNLQWKNGVAAISLGFKF